jgi:hypothetical protein
MCGTDASEGLEEVSDCLAHLTIWIEHDSTGVVIYETSRQDASLLSTVHLVQNPTAKSRLQDVELSLAHSAL